MEDLAPLPLRAARDNAFVRTLERLINDSDKTQSDMAEEIGYDNPNMITMFKTGKTRVPMEKVVPICKAVGVDAGMMLRLWFDTYMPEALPTIEKQLLHVLVTRREREWLNGLRRDYGHELPVYARPTWGAGGLGSDGEVR